MKRIIVSLNLIFMLLAVNSIPTFAFASANDAELSEIAKMADEIVKETNSLYTNEYGGKLATVEDIDFSKAYKVYVDTNIFEYESVSEEQLKKIVKEAPVVWSVPVYYEDATCVVEISRSLPLNKENEHIMTEKQKKEIQEKVGQWVAVSYAFHDGKYNFTENVEMNIQKATKEKSNYVLLGGTPGVRTVFAAVVEKGVVSKILMTTETDDTVSSTKQEISNEPIYEFGEFRKIALEEQKNESKTILQTYGGNGDSVEKITPKSLDMTIIYGLCIVIVLVGVVGVVQKHKKE